MNGPNRAFHQQEEPVTQDETGKTEKYLNESGVAENRLSEPKSQVHRFTAIPIFSS
jgi:hypothetical protein